MTWWEEFSVKWDVMLHRGVPVPQAVLLELTDACLQTTSFWLSISLLLVPFLLPPPRQSFLFKRTLAFYPLNKTMLRICFS